MVIPSPGETRKTEDILPLGGLSGKPEFKCTRWRTDRRWPSFGFHAPVGTGRTAE